MTALTTRIEQYFGFVTPLVWRNIIGLLIVHLAGLYTITSAAFEARFITTFIAWAWGLIGGLSITIGAHRLWTHKTFKATLPLRIFIVSIYLSAGMYSLVQWARDHRTHHKYADTNADPHNAKRGFFFSHMGWLMMKRHPEVKEKGKLIDVSDLMEDPVVRFQQKYFVPLLILWFIILPVYFCHYIMGETWMVTIFGFILGRYCMMLNAVWCVNSLAHLWGYKPYNKNIMAVQNKFGAFVTLGEAWHNYHHTFPWDYRIGEVGQGYQLGTYCINLFAWLGLAYDLKTASPELVKKVLSKQGNMDTNEEVPFSENMKQEVMENNNDVIQEKIKAN